jgi:hypothetical protein
MNIPSPRKSCYYIILITTPQPKKQATLQQHTERLPGAVQVRCVLHLLALATQGIFGIVRQWRANRRWIFLFGVGAARHIYDMPAPGTGSAPVGALALT